MLLWPPKAHITTLIPERVGRTCTLEHTRPTLAQHGRRFDARKGIFFNPNRERGQSSSLGDSHDSLCTKGEYEDLGPPNSNDRAEPS